MNNNEQRFTCAQARELDMVDYLSNLGYQPRKIRGNDYWYLSPLRTERTASFKVNRKLNRWYDHGMGKGGNVIDFAILYHNCTIAELLQNIASNFSFHKASFHQPHPIHEENKILVLKDFVISSISLLNYLRQRHIPYEIADRYCREVRYQLKGKIYYAIGFKNDAGGYELRNPYFKNSSAPKGITMIKNGAGKIAVFEGFFDFLSFLVLYENVQSFQWDFCILNSLSFFEKTRPFLAQYNSIHLFLDNDIAGQNCSRSALKLDKKYLDESGLYAGYKDLNEWIVNIGKNEKTSNDSIPP
jgi:hypothetical protein